MPILRRLAILAIGCVLLFLVPPTVRADDPLPGVTYFPTDLCLVKLPGKSPVECEAIGLTGPLSAPTSYGVISKIGPVFFLGSEAHRSVDGMALTLMVNSLLTLQDDQSMKSSQAFGQCTVRMSYDGRLSEFECFAYADGGDPKQVSFLKAFASDPAETSPPAAASPPITSAPPAPVSSPSFDCRLATLQDEIAICANSDLSALDRKTADLYFSGLRRASPVGRADLIKSQVAWLSLRRTCRSDFGCLITRYKDRIVGLMKAVGQ